MMPSPQLTSEGMPCVCRPARYTRPGVRLQDARYASESFRCLERHGILRSALCGRRIYVANWSRAVSVPACADLHSHCVSGRGTGVAWQFSDGADRGNSAATAATANRCAFFAFHHIDKAGGTSIREWMKELELGIDGFEFLSSYSPRTCLAHHPNLGVLNCGDISTQRRIMHESIDAALSCDTNRMMGNVLNNGSGGGISRAGMARTHGGWSNGDRSNTTLRAPSATGASGGAAAGSVRFRLMSEYHAHDALSNMRHMVGSLARWRSLAAPRGCKILVAALVREPSRWYVSWVAYLARVFKIQPKGGTLESAVQ